MKYSDRRRKSSPRLVLFHGAKGHEGNEQQHSGEIKRKDKPKLRLAWTEPLLLLGIYGGVIVLFHQLGLWQFFTSQERLFKFIDSMGIWDETGFVFLEALQVVIPSIPGMVLNMLGGYLYGTVKGTILSTIGTTMGGYIVFLLSRKFSRQFINKFLNKTLIRRFANIPPGKGRFTVFLLFLIPGFPKDYLCYTLGYLSTIEFLLITGVSRLMGTVLETLGGDYIRHQQYRELIVLVGIAVIIVLVALAFKSRIEQLLRKIEMMGFRKKKAN